MFELLHMQRGLLVEAAHSDDAEVRLARTRLGQRDELMEGNPKRLLAADPDTPNRAQQALFRTTILCERQITRNSVLVMARPAVSVANCTAAAPPRPSASNSSAPVAEL